MLVPMARLFYCIYSGLVNICADYWDGIFLFLMHRSFFYPILNFSR